MNNCERLMNRAYDVLEMSRDLNNVKKIEYLIEITKGIIRDFRLMDIRNF